MLNVIVSEAQVSLIVEASVKNMQTPPVNPQQVLNQGMQLMQLGQFRQALELFEKLVSLGIKDPRLYRTIGAAHERLGNNVLAAKYFRLSLHSLPNQADLHWALGNIARRQGDTQIALVEFERALALEPNQPNYRQKVAECCLQLGKVERAHSLFTELVSQFSKSEASYVGLARCLRKKGLTQQGVDTLKEFIAASPNSFVCLSELAWWYKETGEFQLAREYFQKVCDLRDMHEDAVEDLALTLLDLGEAESALDTLKAGVAKNPPSRKLLKLLSALRYELSHENHLIDYESISTSNMSPHTYADYVFGLLSIKDIERAKALVYGFPKHFQVPGLYLSLRIALFKSEGKYQQIIALVESNEQSNIITTQHSENFILACLAVGQYSQALNRVKELLKQDPLNQYYLALKATALRLLNDPDYDRLCDYENLVFKVPLVLLPEQGSVEELNRRVKSTLDSLHITQSNPLDQSLKQGTQTPGNLFDRQEPAIQELKATIKRTIDSVFASLSADKNHPVKQFAKHTTEFSASWSVKLHNQGHHVSHVHPKGWYSSAYYVDLPKEISSESRQGWLHLGKPGCETQDVLTAEQWIQPKAGILVLFPSFFWHGTEAFKSTEPRLTVAFDVIPKRP